MSKFKGPFNDTIEIDMDDAAWVANRLSDFAKRPGTTPCKAKKLKSMAARILKLCREVENCGNCLLWTKDRIEPRVGECIIQGCHSKHALACPHFRNKFQNN